MRITLLQLTDLAEEVDPPCRQHPELFFSQSVADTRDALEQCRTHCPMREECGTYALDNGERFGVWGGMASPDGQRLDGKRGGKL